jgi:hypothetical protein
MLDASKAVNPAPARVMAGIDLGRETETSHPTFEPSLSSSGLFGIGSSTHMGESEPPRVVYGPHGQVLSDGRRPIGFHR